MGHNPLSVHARVRNILTGDPIVGSGALRHGRVMFPHRDPEDGDGATGGDGTAAAAQAAREKAADEAAAAKIAADKAKAENGDGDGEGGKTGAGADGKTDEERGYPLNTSIEDMTAEQKAGYWKAQARKHETAFQKVAGKDMTPEKVAELLKAQEDAAEAAKTETQRLVDAARKEGEESARAGAVEGTVKTLVAAHVVAAKLDKEKDAEILETLEALNPTTFIAEDSTIDAAKLTKVLNRIAPIGQQRNPQWPATGQGNQHNGTGSAKDAGHAEAARRGYRKSEEVGS